MNDAPRPDEGLNGALRRARTAEFELATLRELSTEFASSMDPRGVASVALASLMGHLALSRAVFVSEMTDAPSEALAARGVRDAAAVAAAAAGLRAAVTRVEEVEDRGRREAFASARLDAVFSVVSGGDAAHVATSCRMTGAGFSEEDAALIGAIARQSLSAIAALRAHELRVLKAQVDAEFRVAREIQRSLLPAHLPRLEGFDIAAHSEPCLAVGGDLYDVLPLDESRFALVVADVSGKGAPASLIMAFTHAAFRALAGSLPPARLMERISELIRRSNQMHRYVTCFYAELDTRTAALTYVNAGHPAPILVGRGPRRARLARGGAVLGLLPNTQFDQETIELKRGDALAVFSDGVSEALNPADDEFTDIGVERSLLAGRDATAHEALARLERDLVAFCEGRAFGDDRTAVILRMHD